MNTKQRVAVCAGLLAAMGLLTTCQQPPALPGTPPAATTHAPSATASSTPTTARTQVPSATPSSSPTTTPTLVATQVPTDLPTPVATAKPLPTLRTDGPYLAYWKENNAGQRVLVRLDADGGGRSDFVMPDGGPYPTGDLAPTGEWAVTYTGEALDCLINEVPVTPPNTSLQLIHIPDGAVRLVTPLFGPDALTKFWEAQPTPAPNMDAATLGQSAWQALVCELETYAWSPNGRYLAFAAMRDGSSSDLYLYDPRTEVITQQSSGPEQIYGMSWAPDGQWLVYTSVTEFGEGMSFNYHAVAFDGHAQLSNITNGSGRMVVQWVAPGIFVTQSDANIIGDNALHTVNLNTGEQHTLCPGSFINFAVDRQFGLVLAGCTFTVPETEMKGITLFNAQTGAETKVDAPLDGVTFIGLGVDRFVTGGRYLHESTSRLIGADGSARPNLMGAIGTVSPNGTYRAFLTENTLDFYAADNTLARSVPLGSHSLVTNVIWWPDGTGVFIKYKWGLATIELASGALRVVDDDFMVRSNDWFDYQWVTP